MPRKTKAKKIRGRGIDELLNKIVNDIEYRRMKPHQKVIHHLRKPVHHINNFLMEGKKVSTAGYNLADWLHNRGHHNSGKFLNRVSGYVDSKGYGVSHL